MSRPFHVLVVASDRALLRHAVFLLQEFGIRATATASAESACRAIQSGDIDFVLADEPAIAGRLQSIAHWKDAASSHLHVLLLRGDGSGLEIEEAHCAGIDDFLRKPISAGELLTRLRAAARYAEFDRRCCQQSWEDPVTGLASRQALLEALSHELKQAGRTRRLALLVLELDSFARWPYSQGTSQSHAVLQSVAQTLAQNSLAGQTTARVSDGRFAVLIPDHSLDKATKHAERLRVLLSELALPEGVRQGEGLTVSVGVAGNQGDDDTADHWFARAQDALDDALRSGGDFVACYGQFDEDRRKWASQLKSGEPFASCMARDVMLPFSLELAASDTLALAAALFAHTRLELLPVVDAHRRFVGILTHEELRDALANSARPTQSVEQLVKRDTPVVLETTLFEEVISHFVGDDQTLLVVVSKEGAGRGYIERERFLNIVKPLEPDRLMLAPSAYTSGTDYLVVPDLVECG
jgi:diguanylate cyclase (GGDEF)-like protein